MTVKQLEFITGTGEINDLFLYSIDQAVGINQ